MANVYQLSTGYMSPQYHMGVDDLMETVLSNGNDSLPDYICIIFLIVLQSLFLWWLIHL